MTQSLRPALPLVATRLLRWLAPESLAEDLLDDLADGYARRLRAGRRISARVWYWRQVFTLDWFRLHQELGLGPKGATGPTRRKEELVITLWNDISYAVRTLRRSLGFTAVVVVTLALGIGANVALVSVVRSVLLESLPYAEPDRVVSIWSQWEGYSRTWVSMDEYRVYRDAFESFDGVALYTSTSGNLTGGDSPERIGLGVITPNILDVLGVSPARGRAFTDEEAEPSVSDVVLISHRLWERRYGSDPDLLGRRVELGGVPRTVVGILPRGFRLHTDFTSEIPLDVYVPLDAPEGIREVPQNGGNHSYFGVARLAPGITVDQARAEALAWNRQAVAEQVYPEAMRFRTLVTPIEDDVLGDARLALWILLVAVGFVLLIACVNVANLVLSRGQSRQRELALRTALGAGFGRVFRQLMTESFVLAALGGIVSVAFAQIALRVVVALEPGSIPRLSDATLDGPMLGYAALATLTTALLFGAAPAFAAARARLSGALVQRSGTAGGGGHGSSYRGLLVGLQLAVAVVLVVAAGLMIRTFAHLMAIDPGFSGSSVLTMRLATPSSSYPDSDAVIAFYQRLLDEVRQIPGVDTAGAVRVLPLASQIGDWGTRIEGYEPAPNESTATDWQVATEGYFEAMGMTLVEGRTFDANDRSDSEPVVVVNEAFANRFWPGESALGHRIMMRGSDDPPWNRIVGVVGNVRHNGITADVKQKWYRPHSQYHQSSGFTPSEMTLVIRTSVPPETLAAPVRDRVRRLDPKLPVAEVRTLDEVLSRSVSQSRFTMALLVVFSSLALVLAAVGVYGVIAYGVSQRTVEFGIRMAMGSTPSKVRAMVLRQGLGMSVLGIAVGSLAAVVLTGYMESVLYGVEPRDPMTFLLVPCVLLGAGLLGCLVPAWRASRVDPVVALRSD